MDRGTKITYTDGPSSGSIRGGSQGGMMGGGRLACVSCHGFDGRGGKSTMMGMETINTPDIRWSALKSEFDAEKFRLAVTNRFSMMVLWHDAKFELAHWT